MRWSLLTAAALAGAAGSAGYAQEPGDTPPQATEPERSQAPAEDERKICRTEKATGSLTRRTRICMTAAQWRETHDRTRRGVDEFANSASGSDVRYYPDAGGQGGSPAPIGSPF